MTPERQALLEEIFLKAVDLPALARQLYLEDACRNDPELLQQVSDRLEQHRKSPPPAQSAMHQARGAVRESAPTQTLPGKGGFHADFASSRKSIGKYELQSQIGRGGFGQVYAAWDPVVERKVAIKILSDGTGPEMLARFRNEASSAGKLRHRNIVTIYDFGEEDGIPYIVMELLEGQNLHEILASKISLPLDQKVSILSQAAAGLHHAHMHGLVHRDVKPGNIMVLRDFSVKLLDFGIVRAMQATSARLTQQGTLIGTASYMSPEQLRGLDCDAQSDIFPLGVVAYELMTGQYPFQADDPVAIMFAIASREAIPPHEVAPDCPEALDEVIMHALAKDRESRYHSAEDMVLDLEPILRELRQQRAAQLLIDARRELDSDQLDTANKLVREVLELDPGNSSVRRVRDTVQQRLQRRAVRPKIDALLSESHDLLVARDFDSALERVQSALKLDQSDARLQALLGQVQTAQEHARRAETLVAEAHKAFQEKNLTGAYQSASAALQADRDNPRATVLLDEIRKEIDYRERERALRDGLSNARSSLMVEAFDEALTLLTALEAQHPNAADLQDLKAEVQRRKAESERRDKLVRALNSARDLLRQKQLAGAIRLLEPLAAEFPNTAEVADLLGFARQAQQAEQQGQSIAATERKVEELLTAKNFDAAIEAATAALNQYPADATLARLQQRALSVKASADRERKLQQIAAEGEALLGQGKFAEAASLLDAALREQGDEAILTALRQRVEHAWAESKRKQAHQAAIADAQKLLKKGRAAEAVSSIQQALTIHPGNSGLVELLATAQEMLTARQRAEAINRITQEIDGLLSAGQLDLAQSSLQSALAKFPKEAALEALQARLAAAQKDAARRRDVQKLRESVDKLLHERRFQDALQQVDAALKLGPDEDLARLKQDIETQYQQENLRATLAQAREHLEAGRVDDAIAILEAAPPSRSDFPEIAALLAYARERKAAAEKRTAVDKILIESAGLADAGQLQEALTKVEGGCAQFAGETGLLRLRDVIRERLRVAAELKRQEEDRRQTEEQRQRREAEDRLQAEEQRQRREAEDRQAAEVARQAAEVARQAAEVARQAAEVARQAGELRGKRDFEGALKLVDGALARLGQRPELAKLKELLTADLNRIASARQTFRQAQEALDRGQLPIAAELTAYLESEFRGEIDASSLKSAIAKKTEEQRVQAAIDAALSQAEGLRARGEFDRALEVVEAALREHPGAAALQSLRTRILAEREAFLREQARKNALAELNAVPQQAGALRDEAELEKLSARVQELAAAFPADKPIKKSAAAAAETILRSVKAAKKAQAAAPPAPAKPAAPPSPPPQRLPEPVSQPPAPQPRSPSSAEEPPASGRSRQIAIAAGVVLALGAGALIWKFTSGGGGEPVLRVSTNPPGATVSTGTFSCTSPDCALKLPPGQYKLLVQKPGYKSTTANLEIGKATPEPLKIDLQPLSTHLLVGGNFAQGSVALDGAAPAALHNGEFFLPSVSDGAHTLAVTSTDGDAKLRFELVAGQPPKILDAPAMRAAKAIVVSGSVGGVEIRCDCSQGDVAVDGQPAGKLTGGRLALTSIAAGTHQFRITAPDGIRDSVLAVQEDPSVNLFLTADREDGGLVVETGVDGAQVFIDGVRQESETHDGLLRLTLGVKKYSVKVDKDGYQPVAAKKVDIKKGALERLSFQLLPRDAVLAIRGAAPGTRVNIDGASAGSVAADGTLRTSVKAGSHTVELAKDGFATRRLPAADFGPGATVSLGRGDVELAELPPTAPPTPAPPPAQPAAAPKADPRALEAEDWDRVRNSRSVDQLEEFRRKYPNSANSQDAAKRIDQLDWESIQNSQNAADFTAFLNKHPGSPNTDAARRRIDEIDWAGVNQKNADQISAFLQRHPGSSLTAEANSALASLQASTQASVQASTQAANQKTDRTAADKAAIRQVLMNLQTVYAKRDVAAVKAIWPSIPSNAAEQLTSRDLVSVSLQLDIRGDIALSGDTATVSCQRTVQIQDRSERRPRSAGNAVTVKLRRSGGSWLIDSVQ